MNKLELRSRIYGWEVGEIFLSSAKVGLQIGAILTFMFICQLLTSASNYYNPLLVVFLVFCLVSFSGFVFVLSFQFLGPLVSRFTGDYNHDLASNICLFLGAVIGIAAGFGVYSAWNNFEQGKKAPYIAHIDEYLAQPSTRENLNSAYIKGKVITVDVERKAIDDLYAKMKEMYLPHSAGEVGTVVWLQWGEQDVVQLTNGGSAYKQNCRVTVIDLEKSAILAEKTFVGDRPSVPSHGAPGSSFAGSRPINEIIKYLEGLPYQPMAARTIQAAATKAPPTATDIPIAALDVPTATAVDTATAVSTSTPTPTLPATATLAPTSTPTPSEAPTLTPTPTLDTRLSVPDWRVNFVDDLSGTGFGWDLAPGDQFENGSLRWHIQAPVYRSQVARHSSFVNDVYVRLVVRHASGDKMDAYGLIFRARDESTHLAFLIRDDGTFDLHGSGSASSPISNRQSSAIRPGNWNTLEVLDEGDSISLFINGIRAADLVLADPPWGQIGLAVDLRQNSAASPDSTFEFDELEMRSQ